MVACIMEMSSAIKEDFISFQGLMKLTRDHVSGLVYSRTNKSSSGYRESGNSSDWTCPNTRVRYLSQVVRLIVQNCLIFIDSWNCDQYRRILVLVGSLSHLAEKVELDLGYHSY